MSDFLGNLARRSVGLAPVVRARLPAAGIENEPAAEAPAASTAAAENRAPPIVTATQGTTLAVASVVNVPAPTAVAAPLYVAVAPAFVAHRAPVSGAAPPAAAPVLPMTRIADTPPVAVRARAPVQPAARERNAAPTAKSPETEPPAVPRRRPRAPNETAPAIVPPAIARIVSPVEPERGPHRVEVRREEATIVERVIQPAENLALEPAVITIQPAALAVPVPAVPADPPAPERTVHVRIGAIEIYEADRQPRAPAASTPASVAPPPSAPLPAGGFDDYAALRSYAPWSW